MPNPSPDPMLLDSTGQAIVGALDDIKEAIENGSSGSGGAGKVYDETKMSEIFNDLTNNTATGNYSHAEGNNTSSSGNYSHAEGDDSVASGNVSHAEGSSTASGNYSHSEGSQTQATANFSHAEGDSSKAYGVRSHAEGHGGTANGEGSHVEGYYCGTQQSANYAHAEGVQCNANGRATHAEGGYCNAGGNFAHVGGYESMAHGNYSFAHGQNVSTPNANEAAFGMYNEYTASGDTNTIYFAVGNGTGAAARSNAFEVRKDGTCKAGGKQIIALDPPTTDGTYTLRCTVSNGVVTFTWV